MTETSDWQRSADARLNTLLDQVNKVCSPDYFLDLSYSGELKSPPPSKQWRQRIQSFVDSLDYDDIVRIGCSSRFDDLPSIELEHDGFVLSIEPIAKKETARGNPGRPIGVQSGEGCWVTSRLAIRDNLKKKAMRYGQLQEPYVIAINCLGEMCDVEEIEEGVFGKDGLWTLSVPAYKRMSAVLATWHLLPWSISKSPARLFHNPHAAHPYVGKLCELPQARLGSAGIERTDGTPPRSYFGLDESWPYAS